MATTMKPYNATGEKGAGIYQESATEQYIKRAAARAGVRVNV